MNRIIILFSLIFVTSCSSVQKMSYDKELNGFNYPFPVKTYSFESQNQKLDMRYMDLGPSTAKQTIVLLHGKNFSGYYWERIANDLVKMNYRVIIPDQIGFGKSSKPEFYDYSFAQLSMNTKGLLKDIGVQRYILIGHSMGGMLATHMSYKDPAVEKLILINPIGLEDYLDYVEYKDPQFFYQNEKNKTVEQFRAYQQKNYYDGQWADAYEELLTPFKGWRAGDDWELVAWNNALTYTPIFLEGVVEKLVTSKTETHLILGTRDRTGPGRNWMRKGVTRDLGRYDKLGTEIKSKNPSIYLYELEGLGHMPQFEDYDRFMKVFQRTL